jgi:hypothetical protein
MYVTYAFQQKREIYLTRQFSHLDLVVQFITDIQHISGQDNVVALFVVESVSAPQSHDWLVT